MANSESVFDARLPFVIGRSLFRFATETYCAPARSLPAAGLTRIAARQIIRRTHVIWTMRTIILATAIWALVPAVAAADSITVKSGVKTEVTTHMKYDMRCQSTRIAIRITAEPTNGTLTTEPKVMVVPEESRRGMRQQSPCVGRTIE